MTTTSSTSRCSRRDGTAARTRAARADLAHRAAAIIVAPVARPSSTRIAVFRSRLTPGTTRMELPVEVDRLLLRRCHGLPQLLRGEAVGAAHVDAVAGSDRAEGVLRLLRMADLPNRDDVERHLENPCDLGRDLDAAPREADDDPVRTTLVVERIRQLTPRVRAVEEEWLREQRAFHGSHCRRPSALGRRDVPARRFEDLDRQAEPEPLGARGFGHRVPSHPADSFRRSRVCEKSPMPCSHRHR